MKLAEDAAPAGDRGHDRERAEKKDGSRPGGRDERKRTVGETSQAHRDPPYPPPKTATPQA